MESFIKTENLYYSLNITNDRKVPYLGINIVESTVTTTYDLYFNRGINFMVKDNSTSLSLLINDFYENGDAKGYNLNLKYRKNSSVLEWVEAQFYYDFYELDLETTQDSSVHTWNAELDYHFSPWHNHAMTIGASARLYRTKVKDPFGQLVFFPEEETTVDYSFFIQDKITLVPDRWTLTIGSKFEKNDYTDFEYQPSVKLSFTPNSKNTFCTKNNQICTLKL